jgi:aryl-alcohol dehydrogenase-like predicted oxidoreductase
VNSGYFDTLQTSFNLVEQRARTHLFAPAEARGVGIIVKRPIANGAWGARKSPSGYADEYFRRARIMEEMGTIEGTPGDRILLALGFTLAHAEVDTAIVGTRNPDHMLANIEMVERKLPIAQEAVVELQRRWDLVGEDWLQRS